MEQAGADVLKGKKKGGGKDFWISLHIAKKKKKDYEEVL